MAADTQFAIDLFAPMGEVVVRRMFGGAGVYAEGVMFALVTGYGEICVKTDDAMREDLRAAGCSPFRYTFPSGPRAGETVEMGYWRLPESALDDPDEATEWGRKALAVALAEAQAKKPKRKKRSPKED
jgi:DNA transformation protein